MKRVSRTLKDGQAGGAWLAERAAAVLLAEYNNRPRSMQIEAESTRKLSAVMGRLRRALNTRAEEPAIAQALHELDGAIWDVAVEHEDRAFHVGWTAAMSLKGGGR